MTAAPEKPGWLAAFHAGERWTIEGCYREHAARVIAVARGVLGPVDAETVAHEVFYRLLSDARMRESFDGGNLGAWLTQVATNAAIDTFRRRRREVLGDEEEKGSAAPAIDDEADARMLIERFRKEHLPPKWVPLFEARFIRRISQRDAARELDLPRTTIVYQEQRIRELLERFLLEDEP